MSTLTELSNMVEGSNVKCSFARPT